MSLASARFHPLPIAACAPEGEDALSVGFAIPESLRAGFGFLPGQHLTLRAMIDGVEQRRSYSICSGPGEALLRIGIRCLPGGAFSSHARATWRVGRCVDVMPPAGRFVFTPDPAATGRYLAIVAGSGITPVLAILKAALAAEPGSRFTLLYGNRSLASTMFRQELADLKDRYLDRLSLFLLFSREAQDVAGLNGRLDAPTLQRLLPVARAGGAIGRAYLCGPSAMIETARAVLRDSGLAERAILSERFTASGIPPTPPRAVAVGETPAAHATLITQGVRREVPVLAGESLIDAALRAGIEVPYACRGGMCCTCRARLLEGEVRMAVNYSLEPWEIAAGYVLTCQSRPSSARVVVDYDQV